MRNRSHHTMWVAGAALAAVLDASIAHAAPNGIQMETVSDYTFTSGGSTANNTDCDTEGQGFWGCPAPC